jgi:hypothetical protein
MVHVKLDTVWISAFQYSASSLSWVATSELFFGRCRTSSKTWATLRKDVAYFPSQNNFEELLLPTTLILRLFLDNAVLLIS